MQEQTNAKDVLESALDAAATKAAKAAYAAWDAYAAAKAIDK